MYGVQQNGHEMQYTLNYSPGVYMWTSMMLKQWSFAVLLLSIPLPVQGQPMHALSNRIRRSVSQAQLMHDRGRYLQDRKRQLWLQELLEQVHTANVWDTSSSSGANLQHVTWGAQAPNAANSNKDFLLDFQLDNTDTSNALTQETNKVQLAATKRKRRVCLGKWRESTKRRGWPCSLQAHAVLRAH